MIFSDLLRIRTNDNMERMGHAIDLIHNYC